MFPLELLVLVTLPAIYVAGSALFAWPAISRPWLFIVLTLGAMYLLYIAVFFLLPATPQGYILEASANAKGGTEIITKSTGGRVGPSLLRSFLAQIAAFSLLAFPSLWLNVSWASSRRRPGSSAFVRPLSNVARLASRRDRARANRGPLESRGPARGSARGMWEHRR